MGKSPVALISVLFLIIADLFIFSGYDLGRNSKTVDVTLSTTKLIPLQGGDLSVEEHFTIFRFPKHGEITVTRHRKHVTSLIENVSIVNGFQKYKCEIDPNSSTKTVHLFNS